MLRFCTILVLAYFQFCWAEDVVYNVGDRFLVSLYITNRPENFTHENVPLDELGWDNSSTLPLLFSLKS